MKHVKLFEQFVNEAVEKKDEDSLIKYLKDLKTKPREDTVFKVDGKVVPKSEIDKLIGKEGITYGEDKDDESDDQKIDSFLDKQSDDALYAFGEDAYGMSDDEDLADEWNNVKDDLSTAELIDYAKDHAKRFGLDFEELKDAMSTYENRTVYEAKDSNQPIDAQYGKKVVDVLTMGFKAVTKNIGKAYKTPGEEITVGNSSESARSALRQLGNFVETYNDYLNKAESGDASSYESAKEQLDIEIEKLSKLDFKFDSGY